MRNWIEIDGKRSTEFGLRMARLPLWTVAAETVDTVEIAGVPVASDRHTGQYQDFDLTLTGYLTRPQSPIEIAKLNEWIMHGKKLRLSTQPEMQGIIRSVGRIAPARIGTRANEIQIPLTMQPFKVAYDNFAQSYSGEGCTIFNRGNVDCEPVYKLTFSDWSLAAYFDVNGERLQLNPAAMDTGEAVIDLPRKKIYKVSGDTLTVVQRYTAGRFWAQVLKAGWNTLEWSSGITAVEVTKNERWL